MDTNTTNETYSTNESQDASSSQQESTASEGNLSNQGYEEGASSSSPVHDGPHNELVQSAIMEVSGEFMMGKFTPQKPCSAGSESSDISDDDGRRITNGGSIAKYPESSTGLSDNDWNPYATESDTAQTPRSVACDEPRWGITQTRPSDTHLTAPPPERFRDTTTTVSMTTGEVTLATGGLDRVVSPEAQLVSKPFSDEYRIRSTLEAESYKPQYSSFKSKGQEQIERPEGQEERSRSLDMLRYVINDELLRDTFEDDIESKLQKIAEDEREHRSNGHEMRDAGESPREFRPNGDGHQERDGEPDDVRESVESSGTSKSSESLPSQRSDIRLQNGVVEADHFRFRGSAESGRSLLTNGSSRQSYESYGSSDYKRESAESARSFQTVMSSRQSTESGRSDDFRRESAESARSLQTDGTRSGRQSTESGKSPRSLDRSAESSLSGRQSVESQGSNRSAGSRRSEQSEQSQKSSRSGSSLSDPDRLDRLNEAGESIQDLIQFESSQRNVPGFEQEMLQATAESDNMATRLSPSPGDSVRRVRLSARLEPYAPPSRSPHRTPSPVRVGHNEYVSVAERTRLLGPSTLDEDASKTSGADHKPEAHRERPSPLESVNGYPQFSGSFSRQLPSAERSPSDVSMKRVSSLFEETKKQVRDAVAIPRPDPSGSEERFPLRERLSYLQHAEDSFKSPDRTGISEKSAVSRDSETARSITSEEVARVLGKYAEIEKERESRRKYLCEETVRSGASATDKQPSARPSAFDTVNKNENSAETRKEDERLINGHSEQLDSSKVSEMSNDEITKRVRAILSNTSTVGVVGGNGTLPMGDKKPVEYVPNTIDYSRLQQDLQEIQDSLHDIPRPTANDSMNLNFHRRDQGDEDATRSDQYRSTETYKSAETTTTSGRESGISDTGRRLVWDHAADLQYQDGFDGQFLGTMTSTDTLSRGLTTMESMNSDTLVVRADSSMTNETERDISPAGGRESIVEQVMNRRAEGYLEENVEDIIARYRSERRDLFDRLQPAQEPKVVENGRDQPRIAENRRDKPRIVENGWDKPRVVENGRDKPRVIENGLDKPRVTENGLDKPRIVVNRPDRPSERQPVCNGLNTGIAKPPSPEGGPNGSHKGLAERVYKILSSDPKPYQEPSPTSATMATEVYKILSQDRPEEQVTGILNEAAEDEHELLKRIVQQQKLPPTDESSLDDSGLNKTNDESLSDREIRKQLEWSKCSSPGKGTGISDFDTIREMTSAPYSAMNNAKTLLSSQLKKMSQQKFDKSVELRTPYRQQLQCYPVYGYEQDGKPVQGREAWMPRQTTDRDITDRQTMDMQIPNRQTTDRQIVDRQIVDRQIVDRQTTDKQLEHRQTTDRQTTDRQTADRQTTDMQMADRQTTDMQTADKQTTYRQTDRQTTDRQITDKGSRPAALSSERFFLNDKDGTPPRSRFYGPDESPRVRQRTFSDPFEVSPARHSGSQGDRAHHPRSKSEEAATVSDLSEYSISDTANFTDRRSSSSPRRTRDREMGDKPRRVGPGVTTCTPVRHRPSVSCLKPPVAPVVVKSILKVPKKEWSCEIYTSPSTASDRNYHSDSSDFHSNPLGYASYQSSGNHNESFDQYVDESLLNKTPDKQTPERLSRSRQRKDRGHKVHFRDLKFTCIDEPSSGSPRKSFIVNKPISHRDDVFNLLAASQQQEKRIADLQKSIFELQSKDYKPQFSDNEPQMANSSYRYGNPGSPKKGDKISSKRRYSQRENSSSPTESDTSGSRKFSKLRPYRPAGSRDMYYTESGDDTNEESVTTQESTHAGSDDAIPPYIPNHYLGSRKEEANKHPTGIYSGGLRDGLSTIDEKSTGDEREKALSTSTGSGRGDQAPPLTKQVDLDPPRNSTYGRSDLDSGLGTVLGRKGTSGDTDILSQLASKDREPVREMGMLGRDPARDAELRGRGAVLDRDSRSREPVLDRETRDSVRTLEAGDREPVRDRDPVGSREPIRRGTSPSYTHDGRLAADGRDIERQERVLRDELDKMDTRTRTNATVQRTERPNLKTREEFRRDWERERYADQMTRGYSDDRREQLGTTVRSDPGGSLESHWEQADMDDLDMFKRLEPEPAYPMDRLRYSRSKSDTDLMALSPTESQKYSSPLQPGTKFLELSTQPSPIAHQDSIKYHRERQPPPPPPPPQQQPQLGTRGIGPAHERSVKELIREQKYPLDPRNGAENPRGPEKGLDVPRGQDRPLELPRVDEPQYPMELPMVTDRSVAPARDLPLPVERSRSREGDRSPEGRPRSKSDERRQSPADRSRTPLRVREKELERELEEMNREVAAQVSEIQKKKLTADEFEDSFPPSKKAQVLREVFEQEYQDNIPPNINDMWTRFKDVNERSQSESSLNSSRMDNLSGLLHNPAYHTVNKYLQEKRDQLSLEQQASEKRKIDKQAEMEKEKLLATDKLLEQRSQKRQELQQRHGLSEEESNGSYQEILIENERKKKERREKRDGKKEGKIDKKPRTPDKETSHKSRKDKENVDKDNGREKKVEKSEKGRMKEVSQSDTMDTLFSIPEDVSPTKSESPMKSRLRRQRHVIDPLMKKLRDKIKLQRVKIDKERRKELQRVEKLKKLEMLLSAKRKGKLSDKAIDVELHDVSSTTSVSQSESSNLFSESTLTAGSVTMETDASSQESSTMMDTLVESPTSPRLQVKKYADNYESKKKLSQLLKGNHHQYEISESDTLTQDTETSDFSNIIVEKLSQRPSEKKKSEKKSSSKGKKIRVDELGNKIRKEKKEKKEKKGHKVFGVKMSDEALAQQLRVYQKYFSPERHKKRDMGTMYPSPIVLSPPTHRRHRDVYMKSAAIQTSPSVRACSPTYSYDEVPVAPVPYMAALRETRRKTAPKSGSPKPVRQSSSAPALYRSVSPGNRSCSSGNRTYSPANRSHSRSHSRSSASQTQLSTSPHRHSRSPLATQQQAGYRSASRRQKSQSPMWEPEKPSPLPKSRMWEPETPDENREPDWKQPTDVEFGSALTWFVPMKPSRPWRKPLKERQAFAMQQETWEPKSVSQSTWKNIVHGEPLRNKSDINDASRDTKFDLDPKGQLIRDSETEESDSDSDVEISRGKPFTKMTLQEAFSQRKQDTVSRLRERQKRLHFAAEERKMQTLLQLERDQLFSEDKKKEANPEAHPYSDNLYRPSRRIISKEEMKELTTKKYKKLPEVVAAKKQQKVVEEYALNRLKARLFNRKVQRHVLVNAEKWGR